MRWLVTVVMLLAACQYQRATLHDEKLLRAVSQALGQDVFVPPPEGHAAVLAQACDKTKNAIACALRDHVVPPAKSWAVLDGIDLEAACDNDPIACLVWAWSATQDHPNGLYSKGNDRLEIHGAVTRACRSLPRGCVEMAYISGLTTLAVITYRRACEQGDAYGCLTLARVLKNGTGVDRDPVQAVRRYREACQLGSINGCARLADEMASGDIMPRDELGARALRDAGCTAGDALACRTLGNHHAFHAVPPDVARAATYYRRGCDLGDEASCVSWVDHVDSVDPVSAVAIFQKACDAGALSGCTRIGVAYEKGEGVPKDVARALALYDRSCNADSAHACARAGQLYQSGALPPDDTKLVDYLQRACDGDDDIACYNLGTFLYERDVRRAKVLFAKACKLGNVDACEYAK